MLIGIDGNEANIPRRVGVNQYAFGLLRALRNLPDTGHRYVIYLKKPPLSDMPPVSPSWTYRVIPFPKLWTQTRLPFDLYTHSPRPGVFFTPSHYAPRRSPVPTVVCIMDLGFLDTPDQFTSHDYHQLKNWTTYSVRQASKIIAISKYTKNAVVRQYSKKDQDVVVTYPGYDTKAFFPHKDPKVLKKYSINNPYFLYLGSLKPSKNIEGLIRAYSDFLNRNPSAPDLVIAGKKAWLYERVFSLVSELKLSSKVIFTDFVKEEEVPILMSSCCAFVLPSFHEGFGIPVLEAMACGVPVVVSKIASLPEVAGDAGIYVEPGSQESIVAGLATAVSAKASEFVEKGLNGQ
jgi:glycosyltransferase involved in cell wall biosynthesis